MRDKGIFAAGWFNQWHHRIGSSAGPKVQLRLLAREKVKVFDDVCGEKEKREGVFVPTLGVLASKKEDRAI